VIEIVSGTAIEVDIEGRKYIVRYMGIEVPRHELAAGEHASDEEALAFNRFLVEGRTVELEQGVVDTDLSGDLLRYVYVGGEMVNKALVTNGYATVADFPPDFHYQTEFLIAEENAKVNLRGIWKSSTPEDEKGETSSQTPAPQFTGGTLPQLPKPAIGPSECDYSGTAEPVIKGNVDSRTGEHIYHVPGGFFHGTTVVDEGRGDVWLCTETEAEAAGWKRSKR
jgi:micrococcal nuclease